MKIFFRTWKFWIVLGFLCIFVLWYFFGGKEYEFIGTSTINNISLKRNRIDPDTLPDGIIGEEVTVNLTPLNEKESEVNFHESYEDEFTTVEEFIPVEEPTFLPDVRKRSKGEAICCQVMEEIFGLPFRTVRPDFLKNPETGHNLEIDCYNNNLQIGVEYNGIQHYVYPNPFHRTYEEFIKGVRRDTYKLEACDIAGVYLITVPYDIPPHMIKDYIVERLPPEYKKFAIKYNFS